MNALESTAALARVDGLTEAYLCREDVAEFINNIPPQLATHVRTFTGAAFQMGYMNGHRDGMNHADKTIAKSIDALLGKDSEDAS